MKRRVLALGFIVGCFVPNVGMGADVKAPPPAAAWPTPSDPATLPAGAWKETVLYGRSLIAETAHTLGPEVENPALRFAGNNLNCQNCHLAGGTQKFGLPLIGVYAAFPAYMARENEVRTLEDRINGCMERSMNGRALPVESREMKAMLAYIQYISTGVPVGKALEGRGSASLPFLKRAASPQRGATVYRKVCIACHQADGQGKRNDGKGAGYQFPPLWGPDSFNNGAGMHRLIASASFIRANMPVGTTFETPVLSVEEAWDVAAYINAQKRPARARLDLDYPNRARKPVDAPFPPFTGAFPPEQHKLGPFQPMLDAQAAAVPR